MEAGRLPGVPVVRLSNRLHLVAFFPSSSRGGGRRGSAGSPPALMADVRVVIRGHFPAGPANRIVVDKVAKDISLRRQPSRKLRRPERVERALAADVLPLLEHPFDRNAVVAAGKEISAYVSGACADPRIAKSGVQILVVLDTFATPMIRVPRKLVEMQSGEAREKLAARTTKPCLELEAAVPAKKLRSFCAIGDEARPAVDAKTGWSAAVGTIGDRRPKLQEERFKGWLPW
ncbi:hypothetical protein BRADI_1g63837v3 [Brachypodium distachyon]|uniref:Uncharacterized protein n=1 Tax=Brachypodium distachyon TaxID=15368 RepID=A0A0Q3HHA6_BRADI|nr:hypothetical protein BRADI_1g63837v3 [Brachypodium distachyon]